MAWTSSRGAGFIGACLVALAGQCLLAQPAAGDPLGSSHMVYGGATFPGLVPLAVHGFKAVAGAGKRPKWPTKLVLPYEDYRPNASSPETAGYMIEDRYYVEAAQSRCFQGTVLEDPMSVEPSFVVIRLASEVRLNATASPEQIRAAKFEPSRPTTVLVHGFTQSYPETTWLRKSRALFEVNSMLSKHNLIIMDWGVAAAGAYGLVAARASTMGSFLANFLEKLVQLGADRMSLHVVGHSLGAHVAGFAGKRIRPPIGRISGLDVAGPCFGKLFMNSERDRLSPDDAYQVDVLHYDDDFLGLPGQQGQFDVYVNGGHKQPGCKDNVSSMLNALVTTVFRLNRILSESHTRATEISTAQLAQTHCQHVAYECRDYAAFQQGECATCGSANQHCFLMSFPWQHASGTPAPGGLDSGPQADPQQVAPLRSSYPAKRLYISTGPVSAQFCMFHYQVLVRFEPSPELISEAKQNRWRVHLQLVNERSEALNITMTNQMTANVFSYLVLTELAPMRFREAELQVYTAAGALTDQLASGKQPLRVYSIEVKFMSNAERRVRHAYSSRLCPEEAGRSGAHAPLSETKFRSCAGRGPPADDY